MLGSPQVGAQDIPQEMSCSLLSFHSLLPEELTPNTGLAHRN